MTSERDVIDTVVKLIFANIFKVFVRYLIRLFSDLNCWNVL